MQENRSQLCPPHCLLPLPLSLPIKFACRFSREIIAPPGIAAFSNNLKTTSNGKRPVYTAFATSSGAAIEEEVPTSPEAHFHVGISQNYSENIPLFLQRHNGDATIRGVIETV
jgi:hypothetical protein